MLTRHAAGRLAFSVITPARNAALHITKCLQSVAEQTYSSVEHIVVDGASTDGTQALVARYGAPVTRVISEPDQGIYDAMNKGLTLSSGDYILFLGADDYFVDTRVLEEVADFLEREGRPDMIYGGIEVRQLGSPPTVYHPEPPDEALQLMICGCLPHQAMFAHRDLFSDKVGSFDARFRVQADYDWMLRVLGTGGLRIRRLDRVVSSFFAEGASSRLELGQQETFAIQNAFPLYRQPEWVERRLHEFQRQLLSHRIQLQAKTREHVMPDATSRPKSGLRGLFQSLAKRRRGST